MPAQIAEYKCPACTGPLHFVGESGKLECDYCGSTYDVAEIEALYAGQEAGAKAAFQEAEAKEKNGEPGEEPAWDTSALQGDWGADGEGMKAYNCPSCGAELICDATTAATSCPYCGNNSYDFYIVIHVNNPYFNEIRFKLNSSKVDNDEETLLDSPTAMPRSRSGVSRPTPGAARPGAVRPGAVPPGGRPMPGRAPMGGGMMGGARVSNADEVRASLEYQQYEQMGQEIREALLQVRQEARDTAAAANAPKTAVTCPYCGATTTPDASGCCEFCGGAIGG